jgi:hypothetical protein
MMSSPKGPQNPSASTDQTSADKVLNFTASTHNPKVLEETEVAGSE